MPRQLLQILVFALPLCVVGFAVLMGGAALTRAMNDALGARVLGWIAVAILLLGIADALLLLIALGLQALFERTHEVPTRGVGAETSGSERSQPTRPRGEQE